MTRIPRAAALLGLFPATAAAADPIPPTTLPGTIVPATPELCAPKPMSCYQTLPTAPTVSADVCAPTCKPGLLSGRPVRTAVASLGTSRCDTGGCGRGSLDWSKLKAWFCWKPSPGSGLPLLKPAPYSAPLAAYFPHCQEPRMGCGATTGCTATGCGANGCAVPAAVPAMPPAEMPAGRPMMLPVKYSPGTVKPVEWATKPYTNP